MPARPTWFPRIPDILAELEQPTAPPFLDRAALGALFHLKRRQSIELMKQLRRYTIGKAHVVDRAEVIRFLGQRRRHGRREEERQQRVVDLLGEYRSQSSPGIAIPIRGLKRQAYETTMAGLPEGIELVPGRLTIAFAETNELLLRLFELAQAIQNDPRTFAAAAAPTSPTKEEELSDYV